MKLADSWTEDVPVMPALATFHDEVEEDDEVDEAEDIYIYMCVCVYREKYVLTKARTSNKQLHELAREGNRSGIFMSTDSKRSRPREPINLNSIMNRQFGLLCVALIATSRLCLAQTDSVMSGELPTAAEADAGTITDLEDSVWKAYKNKQLRSFNGLLYKAYYGVYADGIKTLDMEVADMDKSDIDSYSLSDIHVEFSNHSIAIITYKMSLEGTFDGKDVSGNYYNESVWVNKGNRWRNTFHTAIKAK